MHCLKQYCSLVCRVSSFIISCEKRVVYMCCIVFVIFVGVRTFMLFVHSKISCILDSLSSIRSLILSMMMQTQLEVFHFVTKTSIRECCTNLYVVRVDTRCSPTQCTALTAFLVMPVHQVGLDGLCIALIRPNH